MLLYCVSFLSTKKSSDLLVTVIYTIIKTTTLSVTEAVSVTGWPMHGKQT